MFSSREGLKRQPKLKVLFFEAPKADDNTNSESSAVLSLFHTPAEKTIPSMMTHVLIQGKRRTTVLSVHDLLSLPTSMINTFIMNLIDLCGGGEVITVRPFKLPIPSAYWAKPTLSTVLIKPPLDLLQFKLPDLNCTLDLQSVRPIFHPCAIVVVMSTYDPIGPIVVAPVPPAIMGRSLIPDFYTLMASLSLENPLVTLTSKRKDNRLGL